MTENLQRVFEELTKDCTQEDKAKILSIIAPLEPGRRKKRAKVELTPEEIDRINPILKEIAAAIGEEIRKQEALLPEELKKERNQDINKKVEQFKKQLIEAHIFREKHYKNGLELLKLRVLLDIANKKGAWEAITNVFDFGYMVGYKAAQRNARKKEKEKKA